MLEKLFDLGGKVIEHVGELSYQQWGAVLGIAVVIGFFCLRGHGSRKSF